MFTPGLLLILLPCIQCTLNDIELQLFRDSGIDVIDKDTNTWTLEHHGVPDHGFEGGFGNNPNTPSAQNHSFDIPKEAVVDEDGTKGCVRLGPIGMSLSGAPFYNPYTGQGKNAVEGDCQETFDSCSGHPSRNGAYHYHKVPACLYTGSLKDKFLGVALDGFPIYGPMDSAGKNWTTAELDQCHGHEYSGRYIYRITFDFPYILGCYHGVPLEGGMTGQRPPPRGKRSDLHQQVKRYKRQIPGGNNPCTQVTDSEWQRTTCYAVCENPGDGDCEQQTDNTVRPTGTGVNTRETTPVSPRDTNGPIISTTDGDVNSSPTMNVPVSAVFIFCYVMYVCFI